MQASQQEKKTILKGLTKHLQLTISDINDGISPKNLKKYMNNAIITSQLIESICSSGIRLSDRQLSYIKGLKNIFSNFMPYVKEENSGLFLIHPDDRDLFCTQEIQILDSKDVDNDEFLTIDSKNKKIYIDLLGFLTLRNKSEDPCSLEEQIYLVFHSVMKVTHNDFYDKSFTSIVPNLKDQNEVYDRIKMLPFVKERNDYINNFSKEKESEWLLCMACKEGIFFSSFHAIILCMNSINNTQTFTSLNNHVIKDKIVYKNRFINACFKIGYPKNVLDIVSKAVDIEINSLKYILRDLSNENNLTGMTINNLTKHVKYIANQILIKFGLKLHYNVDKPIFPWMYGVFYEKSVTV